MKNLYYSCLTYDEKQLFKKYCVLKNISSFKMQNYFSGKYPINEDMIDYLRERGEKNRVSEIRPNS